MNKNTKISTGKFVRFYCDNIDQFKDKSIEWADHNFDVFSYFENNKIVYPQQPFTNILAVGFKSEFITDNQNTFDSIYNYYQKQKDWTFGYLTYDLKNEIEKLESNNVDHINYPSAYFYVPEIIIIFGADYVEIRSLKNDPVLIHESINNYDFNNENYQSRKNVKVERRETKKSYLENIRKVKDHIIEGDVYELNYCTEFFVNDVEVTPVHLFSRLNEFSPMPFAAIQKACGKYLICASPERFLKKEGNRLISQPIKGTARRGKTLEEDELIIDQLKNDEKEVAENMMIVDLVRNDLAKSSVSGSVKVPGLFEVHSFKFLHQMISTIESEKEADMKFTDVIKNAFPMGSMTGAPKIMAMKLIEKYEMTKRGLYSGSVGFITPDEDFDFNVVIRSIIYNTENKYLSFQVGSAITYDSDPEKEYEECMLKAKAIIKALTT